MKKVSFSLTHSWKVSLEEAIKIQERFKNKIVLRNGFRKIKKIAGVDVSYSDEVAKAAIAVFDFPGMKLLEIATARKKIRFPYIPGLLAFREGPAILSAFKKLKYNPDVIIFDGQGILHPRRMGIATHIGILIDKPTIGCAKSPLYWKFKEPGKKKGCRTFIRDKSGEVLGVVLCTRDRVKPVFVSCGHKIDLDSAIRIALATTRGFRIPEPLRFAHRFSKEREL